jgi:hypothetical protein
MATSTSATEEKPVRHLDWAFDCERDVPQQILGAAKLKQLLPYISFFLERSTDADNLTIRPLSDTQAVLTASNEVQQADPEMMTRVFKSCINYGQTFYDVNPSLVPTLAGDYPFDCHYRHSTNDDETQVFITYNSPFSFEERMKQVKERFSFIKV